MTSIQYIFIKEHDTPFKATGSVYYEETIKLIIRMDIFSKYLAVVGCSGWCVGTVWFSWLDCAQFFKIGDIVTKYAFHQSLWNFNADI